MRRQTKEQACLLLLLTPSVVAIAVFVYGFIGWTASISLTDWRGLAPNFRYVGLATYQTLFGLFRFQADVRNTLLFSATFLPACLLVGLLWAVLIDQKIRYESFFRNVFLFPMAISFVVTGTIWAWLFNPRAGLNVLLESLGLGFLTSGWLTDPRMALYSVAIAATWQMSGFTMAMYLAGLRAVPDEVREAARVDGASEWQLFRWVILPLLRPVTVSAVVVLGHISLKIFDLIFVMTNGGPAFATDVPGIYMFIATFKQDLFARGAAIAMMMLLMVSIVVVPYLISTMRKEVER